MFIATLLKEEYVGCCYHSQWVGGFAFIQKQKDQILFVLAGPCPVLAATSPPSFSVLPTYCLSARLQKSFKPSHVGYSRS